MTATVIAGTMYSRTMVTTCYSACGRSILAASEAGFEVGKFLRVAKVASVCHDRLVALPGVPRVCPEIRRAHQ